jgi:hypothetical protein
MYSAWQTRPCPRHRAWKRCRARRHRRQPLRCLAAQRRARTRDRSGQAQQERSALQRGMTQHARGQQRACVLTLCRSGSRCSLSHEAPNRLGALGYGQALCELRSGRVSYTARSLQDQRATLWAFSQNSRGVRPSAQLSSSSPAPEAGHRSGGTSATRRSAARALHIGPAASGCHVHVAPRVATAMLGTRHRDAHLALGLRALTYSPATHHRRYPQLAALRSCTCIVDERPGVRLSPIAAHLGAIFSPRVLA